MEETRRRFDYAAQTRRLFDAPQQTTQDAPTRNPWEENAYGSTALDALERLAAETRAALAELAGTRREDVEFDADWS